MDFCSILKLARVDVGNVVKKGENMEGIITWSLLASWFFNQTLSIYRSEDLRGGALSIRHLKLSCGRLLDW